MSQLGSRLPQAVSPSRRPRTSACSRELAEAGTPTPAEIRRYIAHPELITTVYQPIVELASGRLVGYEALSRFGGEPPAAWFAAAERYGMGIALEAAALRAALAGGPPPGRVWLSVNASPSALCSGELDALWPDDLFWLVVEVTEHERNIDGTALSAALKEVRRRGARIAADDVGSGYTGLQRLMALDADIIKLDRSLVVGVERHPVRAAAVAAMVGYARRTRAVVCAEGVQTEAELQALYDLEVDCGQGFLIEAPGPPWPAVHPRIADLCGARQAEALQASDHPVTQDRGQLEQLGVALAGLTSLDDMDGVLDAAAAVVHADRVLLWRAQNAAGRGVQLRRWTPPGESAAADEQPVRAAVGRATGAVEVVADDPATDAAAGDRLTASGYQSMLSVPLTSRGRLVGLLEAYAWSPRHWNHTQIGRARVIASQLAPVLQLLDE